MCTTSKNTKKYRDHYYKNPKICKECSTKISFEKRRNTFCNSSCSARYNNTNLPKKIRKDKNKCFFCEKPVKKKFCNIQCVKSYRWEIK